MNIRKLCHSTLPVRKFWLMSLALVALTSLTAAQAARIDRYVDKANTTPLPPYDAWTNAATDIQSAVDAAVAAQGDQVLVADGVYDTGGSVWTNVAANGTFYLTNRVYINKAIVVRSANNDPTKAIIKGAWDPVTTNGAAAVRCVRMTSGSTLMGFTITNGATQAMEGGSYTDYFLNVGGGIYARGSSMIISNCVITGCAAYGDGPNGVGGGGVNNGTYYDCRLIGNRIGPRVVAGGGASEATLYRCLLAGNVAQTGAGAERSTLYDCIVSNNTAIKMTGSRGEGGGIAGWSAALPSKAYGCTIIGNTADRGGGVGLYTYLSNCIVKLNSCPVTPGQDGFGGGVYQSSALDCQIISNTSANGSGAYGGSFTNCTIAYCSGTGLHIPSTVYNCLIYGCTAGVYFNGDMIDGCTIVGNNYGVVEYYTAKAKPVRNCVVYANQNNWLITTGTLAFTNTCTTPASAGWDASNTTNNPRFVADGSGYGTSHVLGNYRLRGDSPCINAGSNQSWMTGHRDLDGNPRLDKMSGIVDMGAYEYVYMGTTILVR